MKYNKHVVNVHFQLNSRLEHTGLHLINQTGASSTPQSPSSTTRGLPVGLSVPYSLIVIDLAAQKVSALKTFNKCLM